MGKGHVCKKCIRGLIPKPLPVLSTEPWPQGYKTFFMLNSAEHEILSANIYENANNSWHFHIY